MLRELDDLRRRLHVHCRCPETALCLRVYRHAINPRRGIQRPEVATSAHNIRKLLGVFAVAPRSIHVSGYARLVPQERFDMQHPERVAQFVTERGSLRSALIEQNVERRYPVGGTHKLDGIVRSYHGDLDVRSAPRLQSKRAPHVWAHVGAGKGMREVKPAVGAGRNEHELVRPYVFGPQHGRCKLRPRLRIPVVYEMGEVVAIECPRGTVPLDDHTGYAILAVGKLQFVAQCECQRGIVVWIATGRNFQVRIEYITRDVLYEGRRVIGSHRPRSGSLDLGRGLESSSSRQPRSLASAKRSPNLVAIDRPPVQKAV